MTGHDLRIFSTTRSGKEFSLTGSSRAELAIRWLAMPLPPASDGRTRWGTGWHSTSSNGKGNSEEGETPSMLTRRREMVLRVVVFYVLTWIFLLLLAVIQQATGLLPPEIGLPQWGPGLAALAMLAIFRRDDHRIVFFSRETPIRRYIYAAVIPVGASLVLFLIRSLLRLEPSSDAPVYGALLPLILWMPLGAIGEEIGWRGYLHKKTDTRLRGIVSSLLVGILWMPIHVSFLSLGGVFVFFLALLIISYSIVIYALVQDTGFDVLLATVFHLAINLTNLLFLDIINEISFMMINALVWAAIAGIAVYRRKDIFLDSKA
jgi:membrane protease YdiL (CAAX protease family)